MNEALSLSERLKLHISKVKKNYSRVVYYEKYFKIVNYIELFGIFTVNTILTEMQEDKVSVSHPTISKYCRYLAVDKFLNFLAIPTRFKKSAQIFWLDGVTAEEVFRMKDYYVQINKPWNKSSSKNSSKPRELYQKTLDAHTIQALAHRDARKAMKGIKESEIEIEDLPHLKANPLALSDEEYEKIEELPPAGRKYFKREYEKIKRCYFIDRQTLSEDESVDLLHSSKEKLKQSLIDQGYIEF